MCISRFLGHPFFFDTIESHISMIEQILYQISYSTLEWPECKVISPFPYTPMYLLGKESF